MNSKIYNFKTPRYVVYKSIGLVKKCFEPISESCSKWYRFWWVQQGKLSHASLVRKLNLTQLWDFALEPQSIMSNYVWMWAMIIAKTAKYLVWVKTNLCKVSLSVVVKGFFLTWASHFCVCETCPVFAWGTWGDGGCSPSWGPPWLPLPGGAAEGQRSLRRWRPTQLACKSSTDYFQEILLASKHRLHH